MKYLSELNIIEITLLTVFFITFLIQIFYYLFFYSRIAFYKFADKKNKQLPVSIVICAKNEAKNLEHFLPKILNQNYPEFEVVVVNDSSEDNTANVLKLLSNEYEHLYITTIPNDSIFKHGKKLALTIGLKAAKKDWVLLTDADCEPQSENWLKYMQENFVDKTDIVLGYGAYETKKGLLNKIIRFDTMFIALQYFTYAMAGIPYMGVGRNLAYRKSLFFKNKGFASHLNVKSGDDDLFINENANKNNIKLELRPETFTKSIAKEKFKDWFFQKKRHLSTGKYYKFKHKLLLGTEILSRAFFYIGIIVSIFIFKELLWTILGVFLFRMFIQLFVFYKASKKLNEKKLFYLGIIFDFTIPLINFIAILSNSIKPKHKK